MINETSLKLLEEIYKELMQVKFNLKEAKTKEKTVSLELNKAQESLEIKQEQEQTYLKDNISKSTRNKLEQIYALQAQKKTLTVYLKRLKEVMDSSLYDKKNDTFPLEEATAFYFNDYFKPFIEQKLKEKNGNVDRLVFHPKQASLAIKSERIKKTELINQLKDKMKSKHNYSQIKEKISEYKNINQQLHLANESVDNIKQSQINVQQSIQILRRQKIVLINEICQLLKLNVKQTDEKIISIVEEILEIEPTNIMPTKPKKK